MTEEILINSLARNRRDSIVKSVDLTLISPLVGTGLTANEVETAIAKSLQVSLQKASSTGTFWGRVAVQGQQIEYRAYTIGPNKINIGTYYPVGK